MTMFKRLRNRFLILNMSIISVVMVTALAAIYIITYNNIQKEDLSKLQTLPALQLEVGAGQVPGDEGSRELHVVRSIIPSNYALSFNIRVDKNGKIVSIDSFIDMSRENYLQAAELAWNNQKNNSIISIDGKQWQYNITSLVNNQVFVKDGQQSLFQTLDEGYLIKFLDVTDSQETLRELLVTFVFVGLGMLVVIFVISLYFANRAINPIVEAWEKQKQFVADASHELKTPLAIINANSDVLLANQEDTILKQKKWLDYIKAETGRMTKLVNDLLDLAKTENTSVSALYALFDLSSVVNNVILTMEAIAFEKGIQLSHTIEEGIITKGDPEQIKQVVIILLDNALKYTNVNGQINLCLKKNKRQIVLAIQNSGKGIPPQDLPKIFDRFYRVDPSRTQESGGYGLGLSVAKAIIERMGGKIYAESIEHERTTFTFTLGY